MNEAIKSLKERLESNNTNRIQTERMIAEYTLRWKEAQENIVDIINSLKALGYEIKEESYYVLYGSKVKYCEVKLKRLE